MTPEWIIVYVPCLWCGQIFKWYGNQRPAAPTMGRGCKCEERHAVMVAAGRER